MKTHLIKNRPQPSPQPPPPKNQTLKRLLSFLLFLCVGAGIAVSALAAISHIPASDQLLFGISFLTAGVTALLLLLEGGFEMTANNKICRSSTAPVQPCSSSFANEFICPVWRECLKRGGTDCVTHGCLNAIMYQNLKQELKRYKQQGGDV